MTPEVVMRPLQCTFPHPVGEALTAVEAALKDEGFGVLTEIDVQAVFRAKLGVEHEGHRILGVCNPHLAKRALDVDRDVALLLPCTVTLRETEGGTDVRVLDPDAAFRLGAPSTQEGLAPLAHDVHERLARVLDALERVQG
jgi:uncharacterized protein (DUF302 family)